MTTPQAIDAVIEKGAYTVVSDLFPMMERSIWTLLQYGKSPEQIAENARNADDLFKSLILNAAHYIKNNNLAPAVEHLPGCECYLCALGWEVSK